MPRPDNNNAKRHTAHTIRHLWRVWLANTKTSIIREMGFRGNFLLGITRQASWLAAFLFMIDIIFRNTQTLSGWSKPEVMIILALSRIIEGILDTFCSYNIAMFPQNVQRGQFDLMLVKPLPSQFAVAFQNFHIYNLGSIISGLVLFSYGIWHIQPIPTLTQWLLFFLVIACGIVIFYSLLILVASLVFYFERLAALYGFMTLFTEPLTVPFDIFPRAPRLLLTYILPIAFIVFVPAQVITGKLAPWQVPVAIILAVIFLVLANLAWRAGLRRYTSASS